MLLLLLRVLWIVLVIANRRCGSRKVRNGPGNIVMLLLLLLIVVSIDIVLWMEMLWCVFGQMLQ